MVCRVAPIHQWVRSLMGADAPAPPNTMTRVVLLICAVPVFALYYFGDGVQIPGIKKSHNDTCRLRLGCVGNTVPCLLAGQTFETLLLLLTKKRPKQNPGGPGEPAKNPAALPPQGCAHARQPHLAPTIAFFIEEPRTPSASGPCRGTRLHIVFDRSESGCGTNG